MKEENEYQLRVVKEYNELINKLTGLRKFIEGELFKTLKIEEQGRLLLQNSIMEAYTVVLSLRISNFD